MIPLAVLCFGTAGTWNWLFGFFPSLSGWLKSHPCQTLALVAVPVLFFVVLYCHVLASLAMGDETLRTPGEPVPKIHTVEGIDPKDVLNFPDEMKSFLHGLIFPRQEPGDRPSGSMPDGESRVDPSPISWTGSQTLKGLAPEDLPGKVDEILATLRDIEVLLPGSPETGTDSWIPRFRARANYFGRSPMEWERLSDLELLGPGRASGVTPDQVPGLGHSTLEIILDGQFRYLFLALPAGSGTGDPHGAPPARIDLIHGAVPCDPERLGEILADRYVEMNAGKGSNPISFTVWPDLGSLERGSPWGDLVSGLSWNRDPMPWGLMPGTPFGNAFARSHRRLIEGLLRIRGFGPLLRKRRTGLLLLQVIPPFFAGLGGTALFFILALGTTPNLLTPEYRAGLSFWKWPALKWILISSLAAWSVAWYFSGAALPLDGEGES